MRYSIKTIDFLSFSKYFGANKSKGAKNNC